MTATLRVTECPAGTGWQLLIRYGELCFGVSEDPGELIELEPDVYARTVVDLPTDRRTQEVDWKSLAQVMQLKAYSAVTAAQRPASAPALIYQLQESARERDGLSSLTLTAASLEAARALADKRAGRFAATAREWFLDGGAYSPQFHPWTREVPGLGWQHITPEELHGATVGEVFGG